MFILDKILVVKMVDGQISNPTMLALEGELSLCFYVRVLNTVDKCQRAPISHLPSARTK